MRDRALIVYCYLIAMIIYYKLPIADFLQHTQVCMKATRAGASRMMRTMNKALCIDIIKLPFTQLNVAVASAEYKFSPAAPITNTLQCKFYVSQVKAPFTFCTWP